MNVKDLTQSLIALLIVGGAVAAMFVPTVNDTASQILRVLAGTVVGFYFGSASLPMFGGKK